MKKILAIILPILIFGGAFVGLAIMGVIKIPGLTPKSTKGKGKGAVVAKGSQTPALASPTIQKAPPIPTQQDPTKSTGSPKVASAIKTDPDQGAEQLAVIWNKLDPNKFKDLLKDWKDPEVARVFLKMKPDIVAGILATMEPKRASTVSKLMEKQSSIVVEDQTS